MPISRILLALLLLSTVAPLPNAHAQTYTLVYSFTGGTDGAGPVGQLIEDASGNLYGASNWAGNKACKIGCGAVFKLDPTSGVLTALHDFDGKDGDGPRGNMAADSSGNLYGATNGGGTSTNCTGGCGVIYKINAVTDKFTVLYNFAGGADGVAPTGLIRDTEGNIYGATALGGMSGCGSFGSCGTIFKLDAAGNHTVLHTFTGGDDGGSPIAVIRDTAGNLYGTTLSGGNSACDPEGPYGPGCGTVFELTTARTLKVLHSFTAQNGDDQSSVGVSMATLLRDSAGSLYGPAPFGGPEKCFCGLIYKIDAEGKDTILHIFDVTDGAYPTYGLTYDKEGNLYGTTNSGGDGCLPYGCGTVFKLDQTGRLTTLWNFGTDDYAPTYLISGASGNLYGETTGGGVFSGLGTIFKIIP